MVFYVHSFLENGLMYHLEIYRQFYSTVWHKSAFMCTRKFPILSPAQTSKKGPVMPSLKKRYVFLYCIVLYLASLARAVNSPAGSKGLFFRVTYSTLFPVFPSQLWPVFYLESGTHGKMGSIYKHGRWGIGVGGGAALGNSWLFAFTFSPPCPVIHGDVEFTGFLPMREI